ncbi:hypothetical protein GCM10025331_26110 [Actinoplanes utahensis]|nr:hypothetical protein Aut01nite_06530 [Actinoplanes utahensis]
MCGAGWAAGFHAAGGARIVVMCGAGWRGGQGRVGVAEAFGRTSCTAELDTPLAERFRRISEPGYGRWWGSGYRCSRVAGLNCLAGWAQGWHTALTGWR